MRLNVLDPFLEFFKMRAGPVNSAATRATAELVVINFRKRFKIAHHIGLGCIFQSRITTKTARKGNDPIQQVKTTNDLYRLFFRVL